jgi:hypothetical protein
VGLFTVGIPITTETEIYIHNVIKAYISHASISAMRSIS